MTRAAVHKLYDKALLWLLLAFFASHMLNHLAIFAGDQAHIALMEKLRVFYRFGVVELVLIWAIIRQIAAGIRQLKRFGLASKGRYRVLVWSGLYLIFFLALHLSAVGAARVIQGLDTNLYFGVAGYRGPTALFFVPYYAAAIFAAFAHMGAVIWLRTRATMPALAERAYRLGLWGGAALAVILTLGLSGLIIPFDIPQTYRWS